ncbi:carboxymuconolactone decarboxylase family protein [Streptomyces scabiei]|uniref:carboxymuconolactone decarboxylase family protein n=1 Tax=Streptomyces scabiei TaxID=1930 RepID=UPI001B3080A8|nr:MULTISPECIES: carboxymuconolactone decarboxylase family protein [Streptomyces]MBP5871428.1 carboxymuconolactone decarboxylase family protein [Streptomyces sp. LBUM 1485]MBP5912599.1 carboxymuconolactone decarboxylase family protein [Streptomyces sp. LBUM 1486]MDX3034557.1 carboxymuconolactone decarboxylase family protein [Streptomyces scabiei]MDX3213156.1 carboxymuconolactone decarboxylase family protein [Streptomyces scabiei]MDX3282939.1 carboxymuconolactone decarboxylase family protein [S
MTRLDPHTRDGDDDREVAERIRERRGGNLTPLDEMLLHSPPVADGWNTLLGAIRTRTLLDAGIRELAILRIAALNGAAYEWDAHQPVALRAGLSRRQTDALRGVAADVAPLLTPAQRSALAYTDAMTRSVDVPDAVFDGLRAHFDDRRIVELTAVIGTYNLVSRFLVALHIGRAATGTGLGASDEHGTVA